MKHFVRILVTVLILGLLGGGVWYFFFREDPNQVVFNRLTETKVHMDDEIYLIDKNKNRVVGYDKILEYVNGYETLNGVSGLGTTLTNLRGNIFGTNGLVEINEISMDAINYYYSLSASANKVKRESRNNLKNIIENYNNKVDQVVRAADDVIYFHDIKVINKKDLTDQGYKDVVNKTYLLYEAMLDKQYVQNELFFELRNYVNDYVFGTFVPDHKATAYDIYVNQLQEYVNELNNLKKAGSLKSKLYSTYNSGTKYNVQSVKTNIEGFQTGTYINENSVAYLNSYKRLQQSGELAKVIKLTNPAKVVLRDNDYNPDSELYISETIYNSLNFEDLKENTATYPTIKNNASYFSDDEKEVLKKFVGSNAVAAEGLSNAEFSNSEIIAIIDGTNPSLASSFTDEVIYKTLRKVFIDNANTLDRTLAEDAETYGISKDYLVDAQNVLKYIYSGLVMFVG